MTVDSDPSGIRAKQMIQGKMFFSDDRFWAGVDVDETLAWLEIARNVRLPWYPWFVTWFPHLEGFRDDPRMYALAEGIGLEHILDKIRIRGE